MIEGHLHGRIFIPAKLDDNPSLDKNKYIESLNELDPITRRQYLLGDWTARHGGSIFLREWFKDKICGAPPHDVRVVRYWDLAATKPKDGRDPDWTVGVKMGAKDGFFYVMDVQRFRGSPSTVEDRVRLTAKLDGVKTRVYMEQEPGSSGVSLIDYYHRKILSGYIFYGVKTTGSKSERAAPFSSACEGGLVSLVDGSWIGSFLDELEAFPVGSHDDQVDAASGAFEQLTRHGNIEVGRGTLSW
jgi:predicted phage terminase large subunit-like protein